MSKILLRNDIEYIMPKGKYICPKTHAVEYLTFEEMFTKVNNDEYLGMVNPLGIFFQILVKFNLIDPYTTSSKNINEVKAALLKFCEGAMTNIRFIKSFFQIGFSISRLNNRVAQSGLGKKKVGFNKRSKEFTFGFPVLKLSVFSSK